MQIAVLVLAHKINDQFNRLVSCMADDFDVYIHIDKKTQNKSLKCKRDNVRIFSEYPVYWGSYNVVLATLFLMGQASRRNSYDRYLIISGEDVPLKNNLFIKEFFRGNISEYFYYSKLPHPVWIGNGGFDRLEYYYPNLLRDSDPGGSYKKVSKWLEEKNKKKLIPLLKKINLKRSLNFVPYGGTNWMDLTDECISQILKYIDRNSSYLNRFKYTRLPEEIFFHTLICNFTSGLTIEKNVLRYIDWRTGPEFPRNMRVDDYDRLIKSDKLFARKFNQDIDSEIIDMIYDHNDNYL